MATFVLLTFYCICVFAASLLGGGLPAWMSFSHRRMQCLMSFVGGLMLGVALLHLLPHAWAELGRSDGVAQWMLGGLLAMFLLMRLFHVHAHEHGAVTLLEGAGRPERGAEVADVARHVHGPACTGPSGGQMACSTSVGGAHEGANGPHRFSWAGLALGLALHTLIDGLALGAAVVAEGRDSPSWHLWGLGTFLAVALHKPLDALSITSLMAAGGWSRAAIGRANLAFAMLCPVAALVSALGLVELAGSGHAVLGGCLAFAAGVFLCISLTDLLPEVAFHAHDRVLLTAALFGGVALAWSIGLVEPEHAHDAHDHAGHEHGHAATPGETRRKNDEAPISPSALQQLERLDHFLAVAAAEDQDHQLGHDFALVRCEERLSAAGCGDLVELGQRGVATASDRADDAPLLLAELGRQGHTAGQVFAMGWSVAEHQDHLPRPGAETVAGNRPGQPFIDGLRRIATPRGMDRR